ncbi:protein BASIC PENTACYSTEINE6-like [Impatiens glandulifera]|uniref:protein BASIC PENTACYSTEINE6-like n=1 Tax=Impatiens glandulifera TaxID=253017 RepID=UPI001FB099BC|nr:protein BASIC PENTACYSTEINE6-like [Impatiens glandulifera]XP_047313419.1 protein BASIC PENTACYSTEINE6-like [Impatiens glandulifera]
MAMEQNLTLKTYMAIMAERDAAIREKNMALDERRKLFAERDMAMLQRDAAISEKDSAIEERDKAISALQIRESSMNEKNLSGEGTNDIYHYPQQMQDVPWLAEAAYHPIQDEPIHMSSDNNSAKPKKGKQNKEAGAGSSRRLPNTKLFEKGNMENTEEGSHDWENELDFGSEEDHDNNDNDNDEDEDELEERHALWRENSGLNQIMFDETVMPSPICTCTGVPQACYKWGDGGWQSICCCDISQSQTPGKRQARMEGRKMNGSVFTQVLNQLASEGHDLSTPVDLANYWEN